MTSIGREWHGSLSIGGTVAPQAKQDNRKDGQMTQGFFKFPSTPHLTTLPGVEVREDKVLTETECRDFLQHDLIVEEKVDGANLGISFDADGNVQIQNRGNYLHLPEPGQWKKLDQWLMPRVDLLFEHLIDRYILFGEWCYAQHSIAYSHLPDWFLGFDLYDRQTGRFVATGKRNEVFTSLDIAKVPQVASGRFTCKELVALMAQSAYADCPAEGLYLRHEDDDWLMQRAKLVRAGFVQSIGEHWSHSGIKPNRL